MKYLTLGSLISFLFVAGCQNYQVSLNETVMYEPPSLFTDFDTEDPRLKDCLDQAIKDRQATSADQLTRLNCSHAGLTSLQGVENFIGLEELQLSHNQLTSLVPLQKLGQIRTLLLSQNKLINASETLTMGKLERLELDNNPDLECRDLMQLQQRFEGLLVLPQQCKK